MSAVSPSGIVRLSAWYDLAVTFPFATPWTARWVAEGLRGVHEWGDLSGHALAVDDPHTMLFMNLMGSIVVIWAIVSIRTPTRDLGIAATCGRLAFSAWMLHALFQGASGVTVGLLVLEILWAVVQGIAVLRPFGTSTAEASASVLGARP